MLEHNLINVVLFFNCQLIIFGLLLPWILISENIIVGTCQMYQNDGIGLFFGTVCGLDLTEVEDGINLTKYVGVAVLFISTAIFSLNNWHVNSITYSNADRIMILIGSILVIILMSTMIGSWLSHAFLVLNGSGISHFGAGFILLLTSFSVWILIFCSTIVMIFLNTKIS